MGRWNLKAWKRGKPAYLSVSRIMFAMSLESQSLEAREATSRACVRPCGHICRWNLKAWKRGKQRTYPPSLSTRLHVAGISKPGSEGS